MGAAKQNRSIGLLIVGAMSIDGTLNKAEREKAVASLTKLGMGELVADFGAAIEDDGGDFNMFKESKELIESLGSSAESTAPLIFRVIVEVVASDRFVSANEAGYLSAMAKRFGLSTQVAQNILKEVMVQVRGRLEVAGKDVCDHINSDLKNLLSFEGSEDLVGELDDDALEEMVNNARAMEDGANISLDEVERALAMLGLSSNAKLSDAEMVWRETIENLNLPKMADLGETFVSAAIHRISVINEAYKTILNFHKKVGS